MIHWLSRLLASHPSPAKKTKRLLLNLETLEARETPTLRISGYAFCDTNNNGIRDAGEAALATSTINLYNSANQLIGTTTTDAAGFYRFLTDGSIVQTQQTSTQTLLFSDGATNQAVSRTLAG